MEEIKSFHLGMNQDLGKDKIQNGYYFSMLNGTIVTEEGLNSGNPTSFEGNKLFFTLPGTSDVWVLTGYDAAFDLTINGLVGSFSGSAFTTTQAFFEEVKTFIENSGIFRNLKPKCVYNDNFFYIYSELPIILTITSSSVNVTVVKQRDSISSVSPIGWCTIREDIYVFTTNTDSLIPSSLGQIWKITYDKPTLISSVTLIYNNFLNLSKAYPILNPGMIEGRYESPGIQKIYFTDNYNNPRVINAADPNVFALDVSILDINPIVSQGFPRLENIGTGNLKVGAHNVAYRLKNTNGQETIISTLSTKVDLNVNDPLNDNIVEYYSDGASSDSSGKSLSYLINNIDEDYDRIEIIHIYRASLNSSPVIKVVLDEPVTSSSMSFTITGNENNTLELTLLELTKRSTIIQRCKTLQSKKNYLFLGNIKTKKLDVNYDARAFRYKNSANWADPSIGETYAHGTNPDEQDDVNPDQSPSENAYLFQNDGQTLGGSGPNISYKFTTKEFATDNNFQSGTSAKTPYRDIPKNQFTGSTLAPYQNYINKSFGDFTSPFLEPFKGYLRDETYRFGIVFYDLQGNPGYVYWIADIRMPAIWMPNWTSGTYSGKTVQFATTSYNSTANFFNVVSLGLEFIVNIPQDIKSQISGFSIVRCERKQEDKTILGQGTFDASVYTNSQVYTLFDRGYNVDPGTLIIGNDLHDKVGTINSPEFMFNSFPGYSSGDYMEIVSRLDTDWESEVQDTSGSALGSNKKVAKNYTHLSTCNPITDPGSQNPYSLIDALSLEKFDNDTMNPITWNSFTIQNNSFSNSSEGSKTLLIYSNELNDFSNISGSYKDYYQTDGMYGTKDLYLCNYKRTNVSQYGGTTIAQRSNSEYINCSEIYPVEEISSNQVVFQVFQGDSYVCIFDNVKHFPYWSTGGDPTKCIWVRLFPVETGININIRGVYDSNGQKLVPNKEGFPDNNSGIDNNEIFTINSSNFCENNLQKFYSKSPEFTENTEFDTRIYRSEQKIDGELTDSWTSFLANNFIDLEKKHGPLNTLIHLNNELLFLQDKAFGTASVDEKSVIQDASGTSLVLGTGGILDRFDYKSSEIGSKHTSGIGKGINSIIFYDQNNRQFYLYNGQLKPLLGLTSFFNKTINSFILNNDDPILDKGFSCTYDSKYKNIYVSFRIKTQEADPDAESAAIIKRVTFSWNPSLDNFHSFHSFVPKLYINTNDYVISFDPDNENIAYIHNQDNYCNYYGTQYPFEIEFISNENPTEEKIFDNLELNTECLIPVQDENQVMYTTDQKKTFDYFRVNNDYQNTNNVPLILNKTLKRFKRVWNIAIGGNRVKDETKSIYLGSNLYAYPSRKPIPDRIKSNEAHIKLISNMAQKFKLTLKSLKVKYRINSN